MVELTEAKNSELYWNKIHTNYDRNNIKVDDWLDRFDSIRSRTSSLSDRRWNV